jgi:hypothetical protein
MKTIPDFFRLASLGPQTTGLSFVVWISSLDMSGDDVRIWVSKTTKASQMVCVAIQPEVRVVEGKMTASDLALLKKWVRLNRNVIVKYWDGDILYTEAVIAVLKPVTS